MTDVSEILRNKGLLSSEDAAAAPTDYTFSTDDGRVGEWVDADTIKIDGQNIRLAGYDAEEVSKVTPDGTLTPGELGGYEQTKVAASLARSQGYNRLVDTGNKGAYGRPIFDLQNAAGDSWSNRLTAEGIVNPRAGDYYTTQQDLQDKAWSQLFREANTARGEGTEFNEAADWIDQVFEEQGIGAGLKHIADDEQTLASWKEAAKHDPAAREYYNAYLHQEQVAVRHPDRDFENRARNPLSVAWDQGLKGVVEGGTGLLELVGHETGWQGLESWATGKKQLTHDEMAKMPSIIVDYRDVENTGDFLEYVGNLGAMSLPYMALSFGAAGVGAVAGATAGTLALSAPAAVYAGQTWNEMEGEKNAPLAIASGIMQAALDRLGIQALTGSQAVTAGGRKVLRDKLLEKGYTISQANSAIVNATRRAAAEFSGDAVTFASDQIAKREVLKQFITRAGSGVISEGSTEIMQELTAYLSAVAGSDKVFEAEELQHRLINAAIGGGVLGGAFSVPGTAYNTGAWVDVAKRLAPADQKLRAKQNQWADEEAEANKGAIPTHTAILKAAQKTAEGRKSTSLTKRTEEDKKRKKERTWGETVGELAGATPGLWRGATRHIINEDIQDRSITARRLASLFGGQLFQMYSGPTFENAKQLRLAEYRNMIDLPLTTAQELGIDTNALFPDKALKETSDIIYKAFKLVGTDFDKLKGTDLEQYIPQLEKFAANVENLTNKAYLDQVAQGAKIRKLKDYGFRHRALDKVKISEDRAGFEKDLKERFKLNDSEARNLVNTILDIDSLSNLDDAFSVVAHGGFKPSSHQERTLNLSDDPEFAGRWMSDNIFENLSEIAKSAARYTTYQEYLGEGNSKLESMIDDIESELIKSGLDKDAAKQQANKLARGMQDYIDAESGNYKRPTTEFGRKARDVQRNLTMFTTLAALPLATVSSLVEVALLSRGLNKGQVAELGRIAKDEAKTMFSIIDTEEEIAASPNRKLAHNLGLFEWDVGAATRTGVQEHTVKSQKRMDAFFKMIGLKQWTDFTRVMRASMAFDYIQNHLNTIEQAGGELTNEVAQSRDALRALGLDPDNTEELFGDIAEDENGEPILPEALRNATLNFVNEAVVLPGAANRPLFYQDPRFALFTQFQGFISTFQANVLPRLYREAFKGQTPTIKYNAFAVMTSMIMLGFLSQYLKDLIKFGGPSPYLQDPAKKIQRAINSSGLLGTGERVLNVLNPLYESRYSSSAEWAVDTALGESAVAGQLQRAGSGALDLLSGDTERAYKQGWKLAPIVAPLTGLRNESAEWIFDEE